MALLLSATAVGGALAPTLQRNGGGGQAARSVATPLAHAREGEQFVWEKNWYPVAFESVTDKTLPTRIELFGEPIALWYDTSSSAWRAMSDACPHRLAPLSEGRVDENGEIECPYHGWTFKGESGACTKIPQLDADVTDEVKATVLAGCGGTAYAVAEKQGLLWMWGTPLPTSGPEMEMPDEDLIPICEALEDDRFVWIDVSRDMPYSADMLLENVLDSSHVPFTHHQTISKRENAVSMPLRLTADGGVWGFDGEFMRDQPVGRQGENNKKAGRQTERTTTFRAPTYMHHRIRSSGLAGTAEADDFEAGFETWTVAYATPTGPGRSRLFARFPFRFPPPPQPKSRLGKLLKPRINLPAAIFRRLPDWINHMGQLKVLDDDNIFLPLQERRVADVGGWRGKGGYVTPTSADAYVRAYRRAFDAAGPVPHASSAVDFFRQGPLDKTELLDRYTQHTAHCTSCSGALKNAKKVKTASKAGLLAVAASLPSVIAIRAMRTVPTLGGFGVATGLLGAALHFSTLVERRLTSGMHEYPPPRNLPEGKRAARELRTVEQGRRS